MIRSRMLVVFFLAGMLIAPAKGEDLVTQNPVEENQSQNTILTLENVLEQVRQNHPKLYGADLERRIAGAKLLEKQGAFDPGISLETDYLRYNDFSKRGNVSNTFDNDVALGWQTRSGVKFSTGARYNTGEVKPPLYPTGDTGEYFMGVRVPLLRGFRINDKVAAEMQAELGIPLADTTFQQTRLDVLQKAAFSYWDWVAAHRKMRVGQAILKLADFRRNAVNERVNVGDLPSIDLSEAEQEVVRRKGSLTKAEREFQKAVYKFSVFLWEPDGKPSPLPAVNQIPDEIPQPRQMTEDDWMEFRTSALDKRPELKAFDFQKQITQIDVNYARNLRLPIMDLYASPGMDTGASSVGPTLKAGIALVVPLRQRTAKGLQAAAEFKLQKLDMEQRQQLQQILLQVDDAVSAVNAAFHQYEAAKQEYQYARQLETGERERFDYGDSTLFLVNQRERSTAETALKMIDLEAEYWQSFATLKAVSGEL